jgi:magnesium chelatase family protein
VTYRFELRSAPTRLALRIFCHATRECHCSPPQIQRYVSKISGPLLDRIDIHIEVPAVEYKELRGNSEIGRSATVREPVLRARQVQPDRYRTEREDLRQRADAATIDSPALRDFSDGEKLPESAIQYRTLDRSYRA